MAQDRASKTLHYFRAIFDGQAYPLQQKLLSVHDQNTPLAEREIPLMTGDVIRLHRLRSNQHSTFVHLSRHMPGEAALTIEANTQKVEDEEQQLNAPAGRAFVNGHCYMLINGHNIVFCSHGISLVRAQSYLSKYMQKFGVEKEDAIFDVNAAARIEKLDLIRQHGVKNIDLDAYAYNLALPEHQRNGLWRKAVGKAWDEMKALAMPDDGDQEMRAMENLLVGVQLTLDGNTRAGLPSKNAISNVAMGLAEDADDGLHDFRITTQSGETIKMSEIKLTTRKTIAREAQALDRDDCWAKLDEYFGNLRQQGLLEQ